MPGPPVPPRIVKPRKAVSTPHLEIITVSLADKEVYVERLDDIFPLDTLHLIVQQEAPSLFICEGVDRMLLMLDRKLSDNPTWQYRIAPNKVDVTNPNTGDKRRLTRGTVVYFFGFRADPETRKHRSGAGNTYHHPLDPDIFSRKGLCELMPVGGRDVMRLANWGDDVRSWVEAQGLRFTPTQGGLAGQLLKDPRWFPEARRKVPRATNARIRPTLPGNYYELRCPEGEANSAYYLDMRSSHHRIAAHLAFPDPDEFYGRGRFRVTDVSDVTVCEGRPLATPDTDAYKRIMREARGILLCKLKVPRLPPERFPLPYLTEPGDSCAWVYTNELPILDALGVAVMEVRAGFFSYLRAWGVNRYARWALAQMDKAEEGRKRWLKPALLSPYGIFAARPRITEFGFRQAKSGVPMQYPAGSGRLHCLARITNSTHETSITNVVYRGMIEAEQRLRSLALARELTASGGRVLAVYADTVFLDSSCPLPFLPDGWDVRHQLTRLQFWRATAFTSAELTKLPGIRRESLDRAGLILQMRAINAPNAA